MVRISDILRRGRSEEEPEPEEQRASKEEQSFKLAPEEKKEIPKDEPEPAQVKIAPVVMDKTKAKRVRLTEVYGELIATVKEVITCIESQRPIDAKEIRIKIDRVVDHMALATDELMSQTKSSTPDNYLYAHLVNVCLLSIRVGLGLGYNKSSLNDLGVCSLLHDVGMVRVLKIAQQPRKLNNAEFDEIKRHPIYAGEILKSAKDLSEVALMVVAQEHERIDGSGYPQGLKADDIHEYARIVGLIDVFEALTHWRPYREKMLTYSAMRQILNDKAKFDPRLLKILIEEIGIYPVGSWVELNTNEVGNVIRVNKDFPLHPAINVIFDPTGTRLEEAKTIDLVKHPTLYIKNPLDDAQLKAKFSGSSEPT